MTAQDARFAEVYERFFRQVYGYCLRRTSADRAEDVVAETFLVAWRKFDEVPTGDAALPWLYSVAYRVLSTHFRGMSRQRRLAEKLTSVGLDPVASTEDFVVMSEEATHLFAAMERLKTTDQEILKLTVWEELSHAEIAEVLRIKVGAVKQRALVARRNLTREFNRQEKKRIKPLAAQKGGRR